MQVQELEVVALRGENGGGVRSELAVSGLVTAVISGYPLRMESISKGAPEQAYLRSHLTTWLFMGLAFVLVFLQHGHYLSTDFLRVVPTDDVLLIKRLGGPFGWPLVRNVLVPDGGWFYRPVFFIYFATMLKIVGENPFWFHAVSLVLHGLCVGTLGLFLARCLRSVKLGLVGAVLFAFWPVHYEQAIWWVASTSTLFATFFYLLTLVCWLEWHHTPRRRFYFGALASFILALLSKEDVALLPLVFIGFHFALADRKNKQHLTRLVPFALVTLAYLVLQKLSMGTAHKSYATDLAQEGNRLTHLLQRVPLIFSFGQWLSRGSFQLYPITASTALGIAAMVALWRTGKDSENWQIRSWFFPLWMLLLLPLFPLTMGKWGFQDRYYHLPAAAAAALCTVFFIRLWQSRAETRLLPLLILVGVGVGRVVTKLHLPIVPWVVLLLVVILAVVLVTQGLIDARLAGAVAFLALFTQIAPLLTPLPESWSAITAMIAALVVSLWLRDWATGIILAWGAFLAPLGVLPMTIVCTAAVNYRHQRKVQRSHGEVALDVS